jgi:hypothetical protein
MGPWKREEEEEEKDQECGNWVGEVFKLVPTKGSSMNRMHPY